MVAALTPLPVIGVPVRASTLDGLDSLMSIVQVIKICYLFTIRFRWVEVIYFFIFLVVMMENTLEMNWLIFEYTFCLLSSEIKYC